MRQGSLLLPAISTLPGSREEEFLRGDAMMAVAIFSVTSPAWRSECYAQRPISRSTLSVFQMMAFSPVAPCSRGTSSLRLLLRRSCQGDHLDGVSKFFFRRFTMRLPMPPPWPSITAIFSMVKYRKMNRKSQKNSAGTPDLIMLSSKMLISLLINILPLKG